MKNNNALINGATTFSITTLSETAKIFSWVNRLSVFTLNVVAHSVMAAIV
jgi:hypothetical protein